MTDTAEVAEQSRKEVSKNGKSKETYYCNLKKPNGGEERGPV